MSLLASCHPGSRITATQQVKRQDTVSISQVYRDTTVPDTMLLKRTVFNKILRNAIAFNTFSAKAKVAYKNAEGEEEATAYIRMIRDSAVWISLRGMLGMEGVRILITADSIKLINYLQHNVQLRDSGYLQELTGLPFGFRDIQDFIVGNAVLVDSNITAMSVNAEGRLQVKMETPLFSHRLLMDTALNRLVESDLAVFSLFQPRYCLINYDGFDRSAGVDFPMLRRVQVSGSSQMSADFDFKNYSFNPEISLPFSIPGSYKRL